MQFFTRHNSPFRAYYFSLPGGPTFAAMVFLAMAFLHAVSPLSAQENYALQKITFEGNHVFSDGQLLEQMNLKGRSLWSKVLFWKEPIRYEENELKRDLQRILELYFREGFVDARIDTVVFNTNDDRETVSLIIRISEGEPVRVGSIDYVPLTPDSTVAARARRIIERLRKKFLLRVGQRYRDEFLVADRDLLVGEFNNDGFR
ncbi:MAG: POTRA domain-containing protein, partial [candidate division KSB1 bacterium]|nr:POTRA domain-containing protein [candidate division KSB1 bacterium]